MGPACGSQEPRLSVLEAGGVVGALLGGFASDVLGRRRVLAVSFLAATPIMLALVHVTGWCDCPCCWSSAAVGLMATPVIMASVQESFPDNRALANGIYMALSFSIRSIVVVLVGVLADRVGMRQAFLTCAALALLGTPFIFLLPGKSEAGGQ